MGDVSDIRKPRPSNRTPQRYDDDTWTLSDGFEYDLNKFYCSSRDHDSESITVTVNIPKATYGRMDQMVQSGKFPKYKTRQDILRDALFHRMYFLKNKDDDPDLERMLAPLLASQEAQQQLDEMESYERAADDIEASLHKAFTGGHADYLTTAIEIAELRIEAFPDCNAKNRLAEVIERYR